jgi:hypothetical protein
MIHVKKGGRNRTWKCEHGKKVTETTTLERGQLQVRYVMMTTENKSIKNETGQANHKRFCFVVFWLFVLTF